MSSLIKLDNSLITNSYVTLAESNTYLTGKRRGSTWIASTTMDTDKVDSLIQAFMLLEQDDFKGHTSSVNQSTAWPREEYWMQDRFVSTGDESDIPVAIGNAQVELANHIFVNYDLLNSTNAVSGETFADVSINYNTSINRVFPRPAVYYSILSNYTKAYTADGSGVV